MKTIMSVADSRMFGGVGAVAADLRHLQIESSDRSPLMHLFIVASLTWLAGGV
jgi:hypothetical protein